MSTLTRLFETITCPLDGYGLTITLLANPTFAEKQAWARATLEKPGCPDCAALKSGFCDTCSAARQNYGTQAMVIYQAIGDCDLSTSAACVAAFESGVPQELLDWIYLAPYRLWESRAEAIKKKLQLPSPTGDSGSNSDSATPETEPIASSPP